MSIIESRRMHRHARSGFIARVALAGAATALSCLIAPVASARDAVTAGSTIATHVVRYADLDLSSQAGARQLYARLQNASELVCGVQDDARYLKLKRLHDTCVTETLADAVEQVNHARVSALHAAVKRSRVAQSGSGAQASG